MQQASGEGQSGGNAASSRGAGRGNQDGLLDRGRVALKGKSVLTLPVFHGACPLPTSFCVLILDDLVCHRTEKEKDRSRKGVHPPLTRVTQTILLPSPKSLPLSQAFSNEREKKEKHLSPHAETFGR